MWSVRKSLGGFFNPNSEGETSAEDVATDALENDFDALPEHSATVAENLVSTPVRKRAFTRKFTASARKETSSPYARPIMTSTPMPRKQALGGVVQATPASGQKGIFGFLKSIASPAISLLTNISPSKTSNDDDVPTDVDEEAAGDYGVREREEEDVEIEEEEEEIDELADDDEDPKPAGLQSAKTPAPIVDDDDDVILIDDDEPAPPPKPAEKFINKTFLAGASTPGPSNVKTLNPSAFENAPFTGFADLNSKRPPFFDVSSSKKQPIHFTKTAEPASVLDGDENSVFGAGKSGAMGSFGSTSMEATPSLNKAPSGLFSEKSRGFSFVEAAASSSSQTPAPSSVRSVSPTKKAYEEIAEFLAKKGTAPLTAEEANRIQRLIQQSTGANVTLQTPAPPKDQSMSLSELNPSTTQPRLFSQSLFLPAHSVSAVNRAPAASTSAFSSASASSMFGPTKTSTVPPSAAAKARARRRQFQYFGASLGYSQNALKKRPLPTPDSRPLSFQSKGSSSSPNRIEEPSAKRVRVNLEKTPSDDTTAKLILDTIDDYAPPPANLLPVIPEKSASLNPYEKDSFAPAIVHQISKPPVMPKVNSVIREVKTTIAPMEPKSALLKTKNTGKAPASSTGGTPARPPDRNIGYVSSAVKQPPPPAPLFPMVSQAAAPPPKSTFPLVSQTKPSQSVPSTPSPSTPSKVVEPTKTFTSSFKPPMLEAKKTESPPEPSQQAAKPVFSFLNASASAPSPQEKKPVESSFSFVPKESPKQSPKIPAIQFTPPPVAPPAKIAENTAEVSTDFKFSDVALSPLSLALKAYAADIDNLTLPTFEFERSEGLTERSPLADASRSKLLETTKSVTSAFSPEKPFTFVPSTAKADGQLHWGSPQPSTLKLNAGAPATTTPANDLFASKPITGTETKSPSFSFSLPSGSAANAPASKASSEEGTTQSSATATLSFGSAASQTSSTPATTAPATGFTFVPISKSTPALANFGSNPGSNPVSSGGSNAKPLFSFNSALAKPDTASASAAPAASAESALAPVTTFNWSQAGVKAPSASGWTCDTCLVSNKGDVTTCVACSTKKPGSGTESALVNASGTGTEQKPPVTFNWAAAGKPAAATAAKGWSCDVCMVQNKAEAKACVACTTPKPGETAAASSASTAPKASTFGGFGSFGGFKPAGTSDASPAPAAAPAPVTTFNWGAAGVKPPPSDKWLCKDCSSPNSGDATACIACGGVKPGAKSDIQAAENSKPPVSSSGASIFGANWNPSPNPSPFGVNFNPPPQNSPFGAAPQSNPFGTASQSSPFGATTQSSPFGAPQTGAFSAPQDPFANLNGGAAAPSPFTFGGASASAGFSFGMNKKPDDDGKQ
ncbi:hypothetical protein HDU97_004826 [Phlyctochytrium planicorne]|nr:hypothetical protein HDU97_004826 [Phlyctochytrium planicorne]